MLPLALRPAVHAGFVIDGVVATLFSERCHGVRGEFRDHILIARVHRFKLLPRAIEIGAAVRGVGFVEEIA
jgi:hypothetical protein